MKKESHLQNDAPPELLTEIEFLEKWVKHHDENGNHNTMFHEQLADRIKQLKRYERAAEKADKKADERLSEQRGEQAKEESTGVGSGEEILRLGDSKHGT